MVIPDFQGDKERKCVAFQASDRDWQGRRGPVCLKGCHSTVCLQSPKQRLTPQGLGLGHEDV